jgi:putative endonuclease
LPMPSSELSVMFCYVYVLYSVSNQSFYVGFTYDLKARLVKHNKGLNFSTKSYRPWELIYYEAHRNEGDAKRREKYLKTTAGKQALNRMLRDQMYEHRNLNPQKVYY